MAGGVGQLSEAMLWRVLSRSHLMLLAMALVLFVDAVLDAPGTRSGGDSVTTPSGLMITLQWTIHSDIISRVGIIVLYAGCCYVLREILRHLAIAGPHDGVVAEFGGLRESEVEVIVNRWIEKVLMVLVLAFMALAILDFLTSFLKVYQFVNHSWASKLAGAVRTAAPKLFFATVLFFLCIILSLLRAKREETR